MQIPAEYHDREQSYLKHRVLREYLELWGRKIGSLARHGPVTLWYVDCFAGPWQSQDEELGDTSIHIGLSALEEAGRIWRENGQEVTLRAVFVEKDDRAFARLKEYLANREGVVDTTAQRTGSRRGGRRESRPLDDRSAEAGKAQSRR